MSLRTKVVLVGFVAYVSSLGLFFVIFKSGLTPEASRSSAETTTTEAEQVPIEEITEPSPDPALARLIVDWTNSQEGEFAVSVHELTGAKRFADYNEGKKMITASTYKLFLSYVILHRVETGEFTIDTQIASGQTIEACIETLLVESSDQCAYDLGNLLGWESVDKAIEQAGFPNTDINNYTSDGGFRGDKVSTAQDETELLRRLEQGDLLNETHSKLILNFMKRQIWRERIVAGVPESVDVASKPGFLYDIENDVGIVYGEKSTYVLVLLSDGSSPEALADLSAKIYRYLQS